MMRNSHTDVFFFIHSQALYRIVLIEAPLPIERFLANFCTEVPVPPPGVVQVRYGFVSDLNPMGLVV